MEASKLESQINHMNELCGYLDCDDLSMMEINYQDPDEIMLQRELSKIMGRLNEIKNNLRWLRNPIKLQGKLCLNRNERYEVKGYEFQCGDCLEVKIYDECFDRWEWVPTRMEHNGKHYYLVDVFEVANVSLEGLVVRIRSE